MGKKEKKKGEPRPSTSGIGKKKLATAMKKQVPIKVMPPTQPEKDKSKKAAKKSGKWATQKAPPASGGPSEEVKSSKSPKRVYDRFLTYEIGVHPQIKRYNPI